MSEDSAFTNVNPAQLFNMTRISNQHSIHGIKRVFEYAHVQVKFLDGSTIEGILKHIDRSLEHDGVGNLILEGNIIVRGNTIQHLAIKESKHR